MKKTLLFILLLAFLIRLIALNQSLWLDEATTAKVVQNYSYGDIIAIFSPFDFHPPLYYLFMKFWTNFFGYSEIALRFPSVIFSLLTGWFVYLIGGIWAAVFFLFNPLIIYYSQEARMYMMATFFLTIAIYHFLHISKIKSQIFFGLFISLAFLTFYGSIFLIIPMLLYLLYKKQYRPFLISYFMFFVSFILIFPLLLKQFFNAQQSLYLVVNWKSVLGTASLKNLLVITLKFSFGRISFYPKLLYYLIAGLWTAFVWFFIIRGGLKNKKLMAIMVITIILGLVSSFYSPLLQYFRFLYLISMMSILLALGIATTIFRIIVVTGFFILSLAYLLIPQFHREDWKSLAKTLSNNQSVYIISSSADALKYYNKSLKINELSSLRQDSRGQSSLTIIPYSADIYGFDYKKILKDEGYSLTGTKVFRGLTTEHWSLHYINKL